MFTQTSINIFHSVQKIKPFSLFLEFGARQSLDRWYMSFCNSLTFSEFEPRQKLNQSQMSFDNLLGYILSISTQMSINIFHSVQEIRPSSLFQNLELGKASTNENVISQSLGQDLVNINVYAKVYQNIPLSFRNRAIFTFSEVGAPQSLDWW